MRPDGIVGSVDISLYVGITIGASRRTATEKADSVMRYILPFSGRMHAPGALTPDSLSVKAVAVVSIAVPALPSAAGILSRQSSQRLQGCSRDRQRASPASSVPVLAGVRAVGTITYSGRSLTPALRESHCAHAQSWLLRRTLQRAEMIVVQGNNDLTTSRRRSPG